MLTVALPGYGGRRSLFILMDGEPSSLDPRIPNRPIEMTSPKAAPPTVAEVSYPDRRDLPVANAANYFHFSQGGFDIQMSVGQIDITRLASTPPTAGGAVKIEATVTHRFMMSLGTFVHMRNLMDELARNMAKQGIKLPEPFPQDTK